MASPGTHALDWTAPSCSAVRLTRKPNQRLKSEKKPGKMAAHSLWDWHQSNTVCMQLYKFDIQVETWWDKGYTSEKTAVNASKPSKWFCNSVEIKHDKTNINKELHCDHCVFLAATLNTLLSDTHRRWRSGPWTVKGKQEVVSNYLLMMCLQNFTAAYSCQPLCKTPRE